MGLFVVVGGRSAYSCLESPSCLRSRARVRDVQDCGWLMRLNEEEESQV
jgi:hypothetical protein